MQLSSPQLRRTRCWGLERETFAAYACLVPGDATRTSANRTKDQKKSDLRTFLIADVRGYTRFTQEHGDDAGASLAAAFAARVREVVEALGGDLLALRGDEAASGSMRGRPFPSREGFAAAP